MQGRFSAELYFAMQSAVIAEDVQRRKEMVEAREREVELRERAMHSVQLCKECAIRMDEAAGSEVTVKTEAAARMVTSDAENAKDNRGEVQNSLM